METKLCRTETGKGNYCPFGTTYSLRPRILACNLARTYKGRTMISKIFFVSSQISSVLILRKIKSRRPKRNDNTTTFTSRRHVSLTSPLSTRHQKFWTTESLITGKSFGRFSEIWEAKQTDFAAQIDKSCIGSQIDLIFFSKA